MRKTIEELKAEIERLAERIEILEADDNVEEYDEFLDANYPPIRIGSIEFSPSRVLSECDPTAYRCGHTDFNDEELSSAQSELADLTAELADLAESTPAPVAPVNPQ